MNEVLVLVVEDEMHIRRFVCSSLREVQCRTQEAGSVAEALALAADDAPQLVILDLGLPGDDGLTFIREFRNWSGAPILVLSARTNEDVKIQALDAGADDYLSKPFGIGELRARVRALLRRQQQQQDEGRARHRFSGNEIDLSRQVVTRGGHPVHLTQREYRLLAVMIANVGRVLTHRFLMAQVWGAGHAEHAHYLRVYVGRLRQKLEDDPAQPRHILTETGVGYRFQL